MPHYKAACSLDGGPDAPLQGCGLDAPLHGCIPNARLQSCSLDALLQGCSPDPLLQDCGLDALLPHGQSGYRTRGGDPEKKEAHSLIKELTILLSS